jgi:DNA-binding HxlR family transcriptional regulator
MGNRKTNSKSKAASPKYAFAGLDRVFHEKARLGILTSLISSPRDLNFNELKELCGLTDGNLNRHLNVLVEAQIIEVRKTGAGRNTNSNYRLTTNGRRAFMKYISQLEDVVRKAQTMEDSKRSKLHNDDGLSFAGD